MSEYSKAELGTELLWRKCAADPAFFFQKFWHIQHPEHGAILFSLFDAQRRALDDFQTERYVITLKARQIGWTTIVAAYAFWLAFFHDDRSIIFLSKGEREAKDILTKVKYGFRRLPDWLKARGPKNTADNQTIMPFENGSSVESLPSKSDPARGRSAYLVVVDEWAFLENQEEAWASIEPITDVGGRVIGLSTANGIGNFFYTLWDNTERGKTKFKAIFEPWSSRADRNDDWYASKQSSMQSWQLHQEYPRTPEEAFIKSGNPYFDIEKLRAIKTKDGRVGGIVNRDGRRFVDNLNGNLEVWELPQLGEKYAIGADVAEGLEHGDYSSAHVKRVSTGEIVAHWHAHVDPDTFGEILAELGWYYNAALVGVENNSFGLTTCKSLQRTNYPSIYYTRTVDDRTKKMTTKIGWTTSRKSKPVAIADLYAALRDESLKVTCRKTIAELCGYVQDENAKLHGSPFDDRTMSLAITEQVAQHAHQYAIEADRLSWGMMEWWRKKTVKEPERMPLGSHNVRSRA